MPNKTPVDGHAALKRLRDGNARFASKVRSLDTLAPSFFQSRLPVAASIAITDLAPFASVARRRLTNGSAVSRLSAGDDLRLSICAHLASSEGWKVMPANPNHRLAPPTVIPTPGTRISIRRKKVTISIG